MIVGISVVGIAVLVGAFFAIKELFESEEVPATSDDRGGWIYFITAPSRPNAPVKVGMTSKDPCKERLTELRTMSPYPLRIIHKFWVSDRYEYEGKLHTILDPHRLHGEWFDRDATLALIEHLKGAA